MNSSATSGSGADGSRIRFGVLAASRIAEKALVAPAADVAEVEIAAVGARDSDRAAEAAARWGARHSYGSYWDLIESDHVDAVYIGTPAALHRKWTLAALEAGKHVLCEKPLASNADDAAVMAAAAEAAADSGLVAMEGFHWRFHPFAQQIRDVIDAGEIGDVRRIESRFDIENGGIRQSDIRWNYELGGGALMDLGCYPIQFVRWAAGDDPEVVSASAVCPNNDGVDGQLQAELAWPALGASGSIHTSMIADTEGAVNNLIVTGTKGTLSADNPLAPQRGAVMTVESDSGTRQVEAATSSTYFHQLEAFVDAVAHGADFPTTMRDGVTNMAIIDDCYRAAGLEPRPTAN